LRLNFTLFNRERAIIVTLILSIFNKIVLNTLIFSILKSSIVEYIKTSKEQTAKTLNTLPYFTQVKLKAV
jgi:hypothetical protein